MRVKHLIAALLATSSLAISIAWAADPKPEDFLTSRHGLLQTLRIQCGAFGPFAKGEGPLPADAISRAETLANLARVLPVAWGAQDLPQSHTKPEAFAQKEKFLAGFKTLDTESTKLVADLKAGNNDAIKTDIGALGNACKSCHDDFRQKDN